MLVSAKFRSFTVKHALKMIVTSGFLTDLECTKFVFGRGSPGPRWGSLQRSSDSLTGPSSPNLGDVRESL